MAAMRRKADRVKQGFKWIGQRGDIQLLLCALLAVSICLAQLSLMNVHTDHDPSSSLLTLQTQTELERFIEQNSREDNALMTDGVQMWFVRKRTKEDLENELMQIVNETFLEKNEDELSIYTTYGIGSVLEMLDPQGGRDSRCFKRWYPKWQNEEPFSGEAFFDWLDFGSGRRNWWTTTLVRQPDCRCKKFRGYRKMNETEREEKAAISIQVEGPDRVTASLSSSGQFLEPDVYLFIWSRDKRLYVSNGHYEKLPEGGYWKSGHCTPLGGQPVLHAGEMEVAEDGRILWVDPKSGHYQPTVRHIRNFYLWLRSMGVTRSSFDWRYLEEMNITKAEWESVFAA